MFPKFKGSLQVLLNFLSFLKNPVRSLVSSARGEPPEVSAAVRVVACPDCRVKLEGKIVSEVELASGTVIVPSPTIVTMAKRKSTSQRKVLFFLMRLCPSLMVCITHLASGSDIAPAVSSSSGGRMLTTPRRTSPPGRARRTSPP